MNGQQTLVVAGLLIGLYFILTSIPVSLRLRRLRREVQKDKIRNSWADARAIMYRLAREGKLSVNSETFRNFVGLQTFILRRPDEYHEISRKMLDSVLREDRDSPVPWDQEVENWPDEMRQVFGYMETGIRDLIRSRFRARLLFAVVRTVMPVVRIGRRVEEFIRTRYPDDQRMFLAVDELERMQHA